MLRSLLNKTLFFMQVRAGEWWIKLLNSNIHSEEWIFSGMEYFTLSADIYTFESLLNLKHD